MCYSGARYVSTKKINTFKKLFYETQNLFSFSVKERMLIGQNFSFDEKEKNKFVSYRNFLVKHFVDIREKNSFSVFITPTSPSLPKSYDTISFAQHLDYDLFLPLSNLIGTCSFSIASFLEKFFGLNVMSLEKFNDNAMIDLLHDIFFLLNSFNKVELSKYLPYDSKNNENTKRKE